MSGDGDTIKVIIAELRMEALCQRAAIAPLLAVRTGVIEAGARAVIAEAFDRMAARLEASLSEHDSNDSPQDDPQVIGGLPYTVVTRLPETIGGKKVSWEQVP